MNDIICATYLFKKIYSESYYHFVLRIKGRRLGKIGINVRCFYMPIDMAGLRNAVAVNSSGTVGARLCDKICRGGTGIGCSSIVESSVRNCRFRYRVG